MLERIRFLEEGKVLAAVSAIEDHPLADYLLEGLSSAARPFHKAGESLGITGEKLLKGAYFSTIIGTGIGSVFIGQDFREALIATLLGLNIATIAIEQAESLERLQAASAK